MSSRDNDSPYSDESTPKGGAKRGGTRGRRAPRSQSRTPARSQPRPQSSTPAEGDPPRKKRAARKSAPQVSLTSQPTGRAALMDTRQWLLKKHGPICAYCGVKFTADVMTLDHVAPRRGQTAYDRRDNLVLACPGCNSLKRDLPPLAFLLASRSRAANLLRYGSHLSEMLFDLARSLVPAEDVPRRVRSADDDDPHSSDRDDSPYA